MPTRRACWRQARSATRCAISSTARGARSINRVVSVGLDTVARARHIVLASGGAHRARAIRATMLRTGCHTLVTDEAAAKILMELA
jgi:DNA-binding transcriptional regulator LsrR (DeoR family)